MLAGPPDSWEQFSVLTPATRISNTATSCSTRDKLVSQKLQKEFICFPTSSEILLNLYRMAQTKVQIFMHVIFCTEFERIVNMNCNFLFEFFVKKEFRSPDDYFLEGL
jgi:hypothetical protein